MAYDGHNQPVDFFSGRGRKKRRSGSEGSAVSFDGLGYAVLRKIQGWSEEFGNAPGSAVFGYEDQCGNVGRDKAKMPGLGDDVVNAGVRKGDVGGCQCATGRSGLEDLAGRNVDGRSRVEGFGRNE
jgi:hypothetical protein